MDFPDAVEFLLWLINKAEEELLYQRWIIAGQTEMSFEEFKTRLQPKPVKKDEEIIEDVKSIMEGWDKLNGII